MKIQIPDFSQTRALVFGDVMLDRYWQGDTKRISPEAPVPVVHVKKVEERPGGAGNVALNLSSLGVSVDLFAACGEDKAAEVLACELEKAHVALHFLRVANWPTITKLRMLSVNQQLLRADFEEIKLLQTDELVAQCIAQFASADVLILSDYAKGMLNDPQTLIQAAREKDLTIVVDPKNADFSVYQGASVITPNFKEFQAVVGECESEQEIEEKGRQLLQQANLTALLITRGSQGMTLLQNQQEAHHFSAQSNEVYDVTGAGDTVVAVLAASLAAGENYPAAVQLSNMAASMVVNKLGAAQISVAELQQGLRSEPAFHGGLINQALLRQILPEVHEREEKIVLLFGVFDVLVKQQLEQLQQAKQRGDRLLVVVADDVTATQLRQDIQPLNTQMERMTVLAGLRLVDWVIGANSLELSELIQLSQPEVVVCDEDCQPGLVQNEGAKLLILPAIEPILPEAIA